jgi:hypothetical protein
MRKFHYHYYGVKGDEAWHFESNTRPSMMNWFQPRLFQGSELVWCQGLRGGVRLVYFDWMRNALEFRKYGYITKDSDAMREFMWAKLRAKDVN